MDRKYEELNQVAPVSSSLRKCPGKPSQFFDNKLGFIFNRSSLRRKLLLSTSSCNDWHLWHLSISISRKDSRGI